MRLTDIMSHLDLHVYAEIGLIIFLLAFFAVVVRVLLTKRVDSDHMASLPLEEDAAMHEPQQQAKNKESTRGA